MPSFIKFWQGHVFLVDRFGITPRTQYLSHPVSHSDATKISRYVLFENVVIVLKSESCICEACYWDFHQKKNQERCIINKHCVRCCSVGADCECHTIDEWGAENWYQLDSIQSWRTYLHESGLINHQVSTTAMHLCRNHYWTIRREIAARKCGICSHSFNDSWWKLVSLHRNKKSLHRNKNKIVYNLNRIDRIVTEHVALMIL